MSIIGSNILAGASGQATGYNLNNSLRFRTSATPYLNRTPASTGNRQIMTFSFWMKRGLLTYATNYLNIFTAYPGASNIDMIAFSPSSDSLRVWFNGSASDLVTTQVFRDPSAWYHIVVAIDTTQATAANRIKMYVNGTQVTSFSTATYPAQNYNTFWNSSSYASAIGTNLNGPQGSFDGYLTEINFIDGQALTPSSFGETSTTTGSWVPKAYTGTYGTNGFELNFSDIALTSGSNVGLGKDSSGNGNYWNTNNISVTAGVTYDAMTDVPTNTSATVSNYCVMNPLNAASTQVISFANLRIIDSTASAFVRAYSTFELPSSKIYFEATMTTAAASNMIAVGTSGNLSKYPGEDANSWSYHSGGILYHNSTGTTVATATTAGDIVGVAVDMSAGKIWFSVNNTYVASGNPSAGTNPAFSGLTGSLFPIVRAYSATMDINFGQRPFSYTPPSGFVALNTYNLPTPTILQGNKYMNATTYTGNGSTQVVVNNAQFKPDFVWIKCRSGIQDNTLFDSVRGTTKYIISNSTAAEVTDATTLTAFNSNGWTMGLFNQINNNASTYVGWQWQAGQGTTSSNTSGSITSTVSVNATAGFSVVTFTMASGNNTVGHGLGVTPSMIILKERNAISSWLVFHGSVCTTTSQYLSLNQTIALSTYTNTWGTALPTSSVFSVTSGATATTGNTVVAYCFAPVAGYSAFGSYTGNGSTDGPFVYLGFRPKYVMIKCSSAAGNDWPIIDTSRATYNAAGPELYADLSQAESTSNYIDIVSNGFKIRSTGGQVNTSATTYIYMAFAENPFKNANAR